VYQQFAQFAEVVLETATGSDDFDDASRFGSGIPHGVHLTARLGDVAAWAEHDLAVV